MRSLEERLHSLVGDLRSAAAKQDWGAIVALDKRTSALVREVGNADRWADHGLREKIEELSGQYRQLQIQALAERERLVSNLVWQESASSVAGG